MSTREDLVAVERTGQVRPLGPLATLRLQSRAGTFAVPPGPRSTIMLREIGGEDGRALLASGEARSPGTVCDVLSFLGQVGWRGELVSFWGQDQRSLYFDQGHVVGARSTVIRERLGEVLFRHGVLAREQVDVCSDAIVTGKQRFGEVAVRQGFVTREQLFRLMALQTEEIFFGVMLAEGSVWYFFESFDDDALPAVQKLPVADLVREGVRRVHEARFFRARVPSERHIPYRLVGRGAPDDPLALWGLVDGERSVADLCRARGLGEFEVTRAIFQLVQSGHLGVRAPHVPAREAVRVFNEAMALLLRELDALEAGDEIRGQLAAFVLGHDRGALVDSAGPADDGTLDAAKVEANIAETGEGAEDALGAFLYEYASYALFLARPSLARVQHDVAPTSRRRVSLQVTRMLEPITPGRKRDEP